MTSYCDCRICRYDPRPFHMGKCLHPPFHHHDKDNWYQYINSPEGWATCQLQSMMPKYDNSSPFE